MSTKSQRWCRRDEGAEEDACRGARWWTRRDLLPHVAEYGRLLNDRASSKFWWVSFADHFPHTAHSLPRLPHLELQHIFSDHNDMAKGAAAAEKPTKLAKKKSQQDLKADAPIKTKKAKQVEEVATPAATETPSSSKAKKEKKEKKGKEAVKESESAPAPAPVKAKGEKKKQVSIAEDSPAKAEKAEAASPADKKKRKAAAVEEKAEESPEKSKKKRRGSVAAPSAEVVSEEVVKEAVKPKSSKKSKPTPEESPVQPAPSKKEGKKTKAKAAPKAPSPEPEESADEAEADEAEEEDGEKEFYGFSSDDDDSSDEEMADDIPGIDIGKLPTIAKDDETVKRKLEKAKRKPVCDLPPDRNFILTFLRFTDRGPRRYLPRTDTPRFLRGSDARILRAVWDRHPPSPLP